MNMNIEALKMQKKAFEDAARLVTAMKKYSYSNSKEDEKLLNFYAMFSQGMPIARNGRWGNAIGLALSINDYVSAKYLIDHANELNLETNRVTSDFGGGNEWPLKDSFLESLLFFEGLDEDYIEFLTRERSKEDADIYVKNKIRQIEACNKIGKALNITPEEEEMIKRAL